METELSIPKEKWLTHCNILLKVTVPYKPKKKRGMRERRSWWRGRKRRARGCTEKKNNTARIKIRRNAEYKMAVCSQASRVF
jgi:hypothetical protein